MQKHIQPDSQEIKNWMIEQQKRDHCESEQTQEDLRRMLGFDKIEAKRIMDHDR